MRHAKAKYQFNRFTSWRKATLLATVRNIFTYQSIKTTKTKALASKPLVENLITLAKQDTLAARRAANKILNDHVLVSTLFKVIGPRFAKRSGGYTRTLNLGKRRGDDADMVVFELTEIKKKAVKKPKKDAAAKKPEGGKDDVVDAEIIEKKDTHLQEKPNTKDKASKKLFGGIKGIFRKERDAL